MTYFVFYWIGRVVGTIDRKVFRDLAEGWRDGVHDGRNPTGEPEVTR